MGFSILSAVSVIEYTSSSGWRSSGWCAGLLVTGQHFQLLPSDTECVYLRNGGVKTFKKNL